MEKIDLNEYLASNEYPGRGIAVAKAPDGRQMFIGYFIMGRSENSRNRVFDPVPERGGICTMAADPAKLEDPSLIIYNPVLTLGRTHIVTNGDQTDAIIHAGDPGLRRRHQGQDVALLHPLAHRPGHILREQHRRLPAGKELGHHVRLGSLYLNIKALQLPLKGVQPLQRRALVLLRGVALLQHLGKRAPGFSIHPLVQLHRLKMIGHILPLLSARSHRNRPMRLLSLSTCTTRQARPVSLSAAVRRPPVPSATSWFHPSSGAVPPL